MPVTSRDHSSPSAVPAPALPAALRSIGVLARELRDAVTSGGDCDGARGALVLLGAMAAASRSGARGPALRATIETFVRAALEESHAPAVVDDVAARVVGAVDLLRTARGAPDAGLLADLAATLERVPFA